MTATKLVFHSPGTLELCPTCHQRWPNGEEFQLRSFGWLGDLPRFITPSNTDWLGWIHDGVHGRNRFLVLEAKGPNERLARGQQRFLEALAGQPGFTVRVLRGTTDNVRVYRVTANGIPEIVRFQGWATTYRRALSAWVDGKDSA